MSEIIFVVENAPEGGFSAHAVGQSIFTQAETVDELRANVRDAVQCHFDSARAEVTAVDDRFGPCSPRNDPGT
jgi:predicted RNase H-like HicB family nuclease